MIIGYGAPKYLPGIDYFFKMAHCDAWVFLDEEHVRQDFHRANIKTPNGRMVLTVPVQRNVSYPVKDMKIMTGNWQDHHRESITKAYTGCKHHHFRDMFLGFLMTKRWENLATLNIKSIKYVCKILQMKIKIYRQSVHGTDFVDATQLVEPKFNSKAYPQIHGKFIPDLSIVDYLCNTGGQGKYELTEFFSAE